MSENGMSYLFTCDECGWATFVDTPTEEAYPHLCHSCYRTFKVKGDNWKNWEEDQWPQENTQE